MCITLEFLMLAGGIYTLATGKMPAILIGGPKYQIEGPGARIAGALLIVPLPAAFFVGAMLGLFFGEKALGYASVIEGFIVVLFAVAALAVAYSSRQLRVTTDSDGEIVPAVSDTEALIARKTRGSLIYVILGGLGVGAIIFCPLAFIRSGQALRLIEEQGIGQEHRTMAKVTRVLSAVVLAFWLVAALLFVVGVFALGNL